MSCTLTQRNSEITLYVGNVFLTDLLPQWNMCFDRSQKICSNIPHFISDNKDLGELFRNGQRPNKTDPIKLKLSTN